MKETVKKKFLICIVLLVFVLITIPFVSAVSTQITVKTLKDHNVSIQILDPGSVYLLLDSFHNKNSGEIGEVSVATEVDKPEVSIRVMIKYGGKSVFNEKFENVKTGSPLVFEVPDQPDPEPPKNETPPSQPNQTNATTSIANAATSPPSGEESAQIKQTEENQTEVNASVITGSFLSRVSDKFSGVGVYILWIVGALIVLALIILGGRYLMRVIRKNRAFAPSLPSRRSIDHDVHAKAAELERLERKIKEAKRDVSLLLNEDKIREAERRLDEDRKVLDRLKRGDGIR